MPARTALHGRANVGEQSLLVLSAEQAKQIADLLVVVIAVAVVIAIGIPT
jgi:hypothetical protein